MEYWNLIKFNEHDATMAPCNSSCARTSACTAKSRDAWSRARRMAHRQYVNGIVDFQQDHCIGCGYCMSGCPFNIPKFSPTARKVFKCTLCVDRVTQGLEPHASSRVTGLPPFRHKNRNE